MRHTILLDVLSWPHALNRSLNSITEKFGPRSQTRLAKLATANREKLEGIIVRYRPRRDETMIVPTGITNGKAFQSCMAEANPKFFDEYDWKKPGLGGSAFHITVIAP